MIAARTGLTVGEADDLVAKNSRFAIGLAGRSFFDDLINATIA